LPPRQPVPIGFRVTIADRGRLVLPSEVRERLNIKDGDDVSLLLEPDGVIRIFTINVYLSYWRGRFKDLGDPRRRWSDELIAERRREAAKEEREFRASMKRAKPRPR
jgi:AbrB family looped-hinge helix DNA binding protein